jgi:protoporphyrinogen oxidase
MTGKIVISGSGITGLVCALLLCLKGQGEKIIIIEKNNELGGLLRHFHYGEWGNFDYGMHNLLETGINELDDLLFSLLPEKEWQILEGNKRDLAGIYFNGKLQKHTPYIDLRSLSQEDYHACLADFLAHLDKEKVNNAAETHLTAYDYAIQRFGKLSASKTILPSIEKVHKKQASELDFMATIFTPMTRLAFCDEILVRELTLSPLLRDYIAWSDQRTLPRERTSGRKAIYPINYGMYRIVDEIVHRIIESGAKIFTCSQITALKKGNGKVQDVTFSCNGQSQNIEDVEQLIWTGNIPMLGRYLGIDSTNLKYDKPLKTIVVNMVVDTPPKAMEDLYYFFCYDKSFHTYRLTNFGNYCLGAGRNGGYPISMEMLMDDETVKMSDPSQIASHEYKLFGFLENSKILFSKAEFLDSGFPMPTVNNINNIRAIRNAVYDMNLDNVQLLGILAKDNLFFQTDVLIDVYQKIICN